MFRSVLAAGLQPLQTLRRLTATAQGAARAAFGSDLWPSPEKPGAPRMLVIANYDPAGPGGIFDNLVNLRRYSRYQVDVANIRFSYWCWGRFLPADFPLHDYDVVMLLHFTVAQRAPYIRGFHQACRQAFADFPGLRVASLQDEQDGARRRAEALRDDGYQLILTVLPPAEFRRVYPEELLPGVEFFPCLTGYVTDDLLALDFPVAGPWPLDLSFRGNDVAFHHGRLAYEKYRLSARFQAICEARGLTCDISSEWFDRVYGRAWFELMGRSKGVLGVESGTTGFDLDGGVAEAVAAYRSAHPEAGFDQVYEAVIAPQEFPVDYRQVAPRHFEAAACRAVQVLYEGQYSGLFRAGEHFLSLAWDHSNLDEVLAELADPARRQELTDRAYAEVIENPALHYKAFVSRLDDRMDALRA